MSLTLDEIRASCERALRERDEQQRERDRQEAARIAAEQRAQAELLAAALRSEEER